MKLKVEQAIEKAYNKANKIDGSSQNLYEIIRSYKALESLTQEQEDAIYNNICDRLGYSNKPQFTNEQGKLLNKLIGYEYYDNCD